MMRLTEQSHCAGVQVTEKDGKLTVTVEGDKAVKLQINKKPYSLTVVSKSSETQHTPDTLVLHICLAQKLSSCHLTC